MKKLNKFSLKGFTLIEILIYIFVLVIIVLAISSFLIWAIRSDAKNKAMREVLHNGERAMATITHEIKEARAIYYPTSLFNSHPGQLSLETLKYLPTQEENSYLDFYLCGSQLCFKKESQEPYAITSDNVSVSNLIFNLIMIDQTPSIQIIIKINYNNFQDRPEFLSSVELQSTVSLRSY